MKLIIGIKELRAHHIIKASRGVLPEYEGICFRDGRVLSTDGKIAMHTDDIINPAQIGLVVKVERIPTGEKYRTAVIDTEARACYFLADRLVNVRDLDGYNLAERRLSMCAATVILTAGYPPVESRIVNRPAKIQNITLATPLLERLHKLARAIGLKSKDSPVELTFQGSKGEAVGAVLKSGSTQLNVIIKPMK